MRFAMLAASALLLGAALPASAVKMLMKMSPKNLESEGFTLTTRRTENGMVEFRLLRDPARARWQGRYATLEVSSERGRVVRCSLEPDTRRKQVTYRFDIAPEHAAHSTLTVSEVQTDLKNPDGEQLIGGGTIYEFRLADFVGR